MGYGDRPIRLAECTQRCRSTQLSMHGGDNWVNAGPDMAHGRPPGSYRVLDGEHLCDSDATGAMPLLRWWFRGFRACAPARWWISER